MPGVPRSTTLGIHLAPAVRDQFIGKAHASSNDGHKLVLEPPKERFARLEDEPGTVRVCHERLADP